VPDGGREEDEFYSKCGVFLSGEGVSLPIAGVYAESVRHGPENGNLENHRYQSKSTE
jgi:hypothetical protein